MNKFMGTVLLVVAILLVNTSMAAAVTIVDPTNGDKSLQQILDDITVGPDLRKDTLGQYDSSIVATGSDNSALADDDYWKIDASGGSVATFIIEISPNASGNTFGIYDPTKNLNDPTAYVEIFNGSETNSYQHTISICESGFVSFNGCAPNVETTGIKFGGNTFGFYIGTGDQLLYSDSSKNSDGNDHLAVFEGGNGDNVKIDGYGGGPWEDNEYILAWDDMSNGSLASGGGDSDFNDMIIMVESVSPSHVPSGGGSSSVPEPSSILLLGGGLLGLGFAGYRKINK